MLFRSKREWETSGGTLTPLFIVLWYQSAALKIESSVVTPAHCAVSFLQRGRRFRLGILESGSEIQQWKRLSFCRSLFLFPQSRSFLHSAFCMLHSTIRRDKCIVVLHYQTGCALCYLTSISTFYSFIWCIVAVMHGCIIVIIIIIIVIVVLLARSLHNVTATE